MRISLLTLYSTPFTPSYRNVLTGRSSALSDTELSSIFTQISEARGHKKLTWALVDDNAKPKSFKYRNSRCVVNVPYDSNDLLSYNYCVTYAYNIGTQKDEYTYWFVESVESLNDGTNANGQSKPCSSITLLRDCWTNNERELHEINKSMEYQMGTAYSQLTVDQATVYNTLHPLNYSFEEYHKPKYTNRYQILWVKYTLDTKDVSIFRAFPSGDSIIDDSLWDLYADNNAYPTVLQPIGLFDVELCKLVTTSANNTFILNFPDSKLSSLQLELYSYSVSIPNSTHILKAEFTFCVPFKYTVEVSQAGDYSTTIRGVSICTGLSIGDDGAIVNAVYTSMKFYQESTDIENIKPYYNSYESIEIHTPRITNFENKIYTEQEIIANNYYNQKFPQKCNSIFVNNNYSHITIPEGISYIILEYYRYRNFPSYRYAYYKPNGEVLYSFFIPISNNGEFLTASTAYDAYMRNNGNAFIANTIKNLTSSIIGGAMKGSAGGAVGAVVGAGIGAVGSVAKTVATVNDLHNQQDIINIPSYDANKTPLYQDLILYYEDSIDYHCQSIVALTAHKYGSNTPFVKPFNAHYARNFEYAEIPNPNITLSNADDTIIVNNALNKGLTMWLVDRPDNLKIFTDVDLQALAFLNTNVSNPYFTGDTT